jgi:hypothetical protein
MATFAQSAGSAGLSDGWPTWNAIRIGIRSARSAACEDP